MTNYELTTLVIELTGLEQGDILKSPEEHERDDTRSKEICSLLDEKYPEDILDKYGLYGHKVEVYTGDILKVQRRRVDELDNVTIWRK